MVSLRNSFFDRTDSEVGSCSPLLCGGRTEGAATASYHIGRGTFDSTIFIFHAPIQARILFETFFGVEGVESSPRLCDKELRYLGWAPLFCHNPVSQVVRYLQQERGAASSVRAGIPHPFKCAAAAVHTLSHPLLSPPSTHTPWVFGRAITPTFYRTPKYTLWVSDVVSPPGVSHTP